MMTLINALYLSKIISCYSLSTESVRLSQLFPSEGKRPFFSVPSIKKYFPFVTRLPLALCLLPDFQVILPSQSCHVFIFLI